MLQFLPFAEGSLLASLDLYFSRSYTKFIGPSSPHSLRLILSHLMLLRANMCCQICMSPLGGHLKNILFTSPDRHCFSGQKKHQTLCRRIGKFHYYNFWKFQNFFRIFKRENCHKYLPPVQRIIHLCMINFHLFLFIGKDGTDWINYSVRQNRNFMFVLNKFFRR